MANSYGTVTIDSTAEKVISANGQRRGLIIQNNGTAIVYLGFDDQVTSSNGIPILPQGSIEFTRVFDGLRVEVWGISATGSQDVRYMEWEH